MQPEVVSAMASPPPSPGRSLPRRPYSHYQRASTASVVSPTRQTRTHVNVADGLTSRSSEDDVPRTAVRVAVRVRPPLQPSDPGFDLIPQRFRHSTCDVPTTTSLSVQSPQGKKLFVFDRVFPEDTTQDGIWDYLNDSVSSFVNGYNVSILAYGQSGSGKSYTMGTSGPDDQGDQQVMGIIPRAARTLFEKLLGTSLPKRQSGLPTPKNYSSQGIPTLNGLPKSGTATPDRSWTLKATYVEIYQEQLRDLLVSETVPLADRAPVTIREDAKGRILVTGLTQVTINSVDDLLQALAFGSSIRQTDATNINARSSRSHAVFSLNLVQKRAEAPVPLSKPDKRISVPIDSAIPGTENVVTLDSKLHFVDLAGSERLKNTGATGDRAKEGISINAGLASLGKVIAQLSTKHANAHISYRDSRLTRLLQDSLGGNAVTFMVACVTPAVFHLSETLNTVHYAQRARAIQSKPEIQRSREEGDKQAAIDRLRAEVSFLRDQIRHAADPDAKGGDAAGTAARGLSERARGREAELQQELLDMQENYNTLSQRHARLVADLAQARGGDTGGSDGTDLPASVSAAIGDHAMDRIQRSSSFAEAVEQMVLEYEKTIQSLESSLSKTRGSLSNTESTLMEKETRIAYMETIQQQLQARVQKAVDREQSNESYLRDLESQMEGTVDGEQRSAALVAELRKELSRVRDNENTAEEYISTLEERLADAEQDQETMQREIDRLEHVVERQRSIGRLDNLLGELDGIRGLSSTTPPAVNGEVERSPSLPPVVPSARVNGNRESYDPFRPPSAQEVRSDETVGVTQEESHAALEQIPERDDIAVTDEVVQSDAVAHTATQSDFMADKLENMTQELFDLRSEHESVVTDYDKLQQKYRTALETLAKLEYEKDDLPQSPLSGSAYSSDSFLADAGMRGGEEEVNGERSSSSRSSLEEPSSPPLPNSSLDGLTEKIGLEESSRSLAPLVDDNNDVDPSQVALPEDDEVATEDDQELETLRRLHMEKEEAFNELTKHYNSLREKHESTLAQVEDLKLGVQRAQSFRPVSQNFNKSMFRRKSEDLLGNMDARASRSLASLKTMAGDTFENDPDLRAAFDININTLVGELTTRSERIFALEAEMSTTKKELDAKQTIISGLTRERSSLKAASTVDFSVVGQMQEQLRESENQIRSLHEQHETREKAFQGQIESLKASLAAHTNQLPTPVDELVSSQIPGDFPATPADDMSRELTPIATAVPAESSSQDEIVTRLQTELGAWEVKHGSVMTEMQATEAKLLETIAALESSLRDAEASRVTPSADLESTPAPTESAILQSIEGERLKHREMVDSLQRDVDEHKSTANMHLEKLQQLEQSYEDVVQKLEADAQTRDLSSRELQEHRELVANLEKQLEIHNTTIMQHQDSLQSLQDSHAKEIDDLQVSMAAATRESQDQFAALEESHTATTKDLQAELNASQTAHADLLRNASAALGYATSDAMLKSHISGLVDEGKELHARHLKSIDELKGVQEELQSALATNVDLENRVAELKTLHDEVVQSLDTVSQREKKSARMVEELEEQLTSNFDSHKATTNRLSVMQDEVAQQRVELERELEDQKMRNSVLEQQVAALQRQSVTSNVSFNRESLSPEAAAIALARSASSSSSQQQIPPASTMPAPPPTRKSSVPTALPTPPPSIPLPPLPSSPTSAGPVLNGIDHWTTATPTSPAMSTFSVNALPPIQTTHNTSPPGSRHVSKEVGASSAPPAAPTQAVEEHEARIRTIEKHLFAEKQLTATLEEALVDLETSANRTKSEMDSWRKKCAALEDELVGLRKERSSTSRASLQAVEEEREMRVRAERARQALEQRMMELNASGATGNAAGGMGSKKKKKNALNCF